MSQIVGSALIGTLLDCSLSRRKRAGLGWITLFVLVMAVFAGDYVVQKTYSRESIAANVLKGISMDVYDEGYAGHIVLYMFNG